MPRFWKFYFFFKIENFTAVLDADISSRCAIEVQDQISMSWFLRHQGASTSSAHRQQEGSRYGHDDGPRDGLILCCLPSGCPRRFEDPIDPVRPVGAVRVSCSDERCDVGSWMMHGDCFADWEEEVLAYLCCSNGRGRGWSDRQQRSQSEWLAQKVIYSSVNN